jgi:hypothetical protein
MALLTCVRCRCELDQFAVAGGEAMVICVTCQTIGKTHEIGQGARMIDIDREPRQPGRIGSRRTSVVRGRAAAR